MSQNNYEELVSALLFSLQQRDTGLHNRDFLLTWEQPLDAIEGVIETAESLRLMVEADISTRVFDTGLAISLFRDQSTRTRFAYATAASLLGLSLVEFDEKKTQIAHGETVRETANMISFVAESIGIRDDIYLGEGDAFMREVSEALTEGHQSKILPQRPAVVNLQSDLDHPTQSLSDLMHLRNEFGDLENLRGKKIAVTWAYSPSYGKPLSVPQGLIGLLPRYGMDVVLAHPEGYDLLPDIVEKAGEFAKESGGSFKQVNSMEEAFEDADIVYPKSWAPYQVMEQRTAYLRGGESDKLDALEEECLATNAKHKNWECNADMMKRTKNGEALYMHCLPADISGVSCEQGEVSADVFEKYRLTTYREASYKPYVIAAMIMMCRFAKPADILRELLNEAKPRRAR
ncbi:MAG: knotted carbamoyltransferase YgeW [Deltaproteobacteria bacterium]|nr:MAG: knotted carbamoyltransferase YgeW [Deltaproteobacteria bacterium]